MSTYHPQQGVSRYRGIICCLVYATALFSATHIALGHEEHPALYAAQKEYYLDKAIQFLAYSVFTVIVGLAFVPMPDDPSETLSDLTADRLIRVAMAVGLFAILDEGTQPFFGRNFEIADCIANIMGIAIGLVGFLLLNEARSHLEN
jgi:hypothetical protein